MIRQVSSCLRALGSLVLVAGLLAGCGQAAAPAPTATAVPPAATAAPPTPTPPAPTAPVARVPRFEPAPCPFDVPGDRLEGRDVRCGYLVVPEQHSVPAGPTIKLAVAIFKARGDTVQPDPIVYLQGGPGGSSQGPILGFQGAYAKALGQDRDVIYFDQRGTGYSQPNLACPEVAQQGIADYAANLTVAEESAHQMAALEHCRYRLASQGVNLAAYHTTENAADLNDLRVALGLRQLNLLGGSYGSRLGLITMRDYPDAVRSAVLQGIYPPPQNHDEQMPRSFDRALTLVFDACAADPACAAAYPDLPGTFSAVVRDLAAHPVTLQVAAGERTYPLVASGHRFTQVLRALVYQVAGIQQIPSLIYRVHRGDTAPLAPLAAQAIALANSSALGMYYSTECNEETPFNSRASLAAALRDVRPEIRDAFNWYQDLTVCDSWPSGTAPARENAPVVSAVPALLLTGWYDPVTPPAYGESAVATLGQGHHVLFPADAHGVEGNAPACAVSLFAAFIHDPQAPLDAGCAQALRLHFVLPP